MTDFDSISFRGEPEKSQKAKIWQTDSVKCTSPTFKVSLQSLKMTL